MARLINLVFVLTLGLVVQERHVQAQDNVLNLLDSKQAIMIRIEQPDEFSRELGKLDFFQHPSFLQVKDYLLSNKFEQLAKASNLPLVLSKADPADQLTWKEIFDGPVTAVVTVNKRRPPDWLITFETDQAEFFDLATAICNRLNLAPEEFTRANTVEQEIQGVTTNSILPSGCVVFFSDRRCFVCSNASQAKTMIKRLQGHDVPKRSFLSNRKFVAATKRSKKLDGEMLAQIFVDPELCKSLLPMVPNEAWKLLGFEMISALFFEVSRPDGIKTSIAKAQVCVDGWVGVRVPTTGSLDAVLGSRGFSTIPDIEVDEPIEVLAVGIDAEKCFDGFSKQFDEISESKGATDRLVKLFEKSSGFKEGFVDRLLKSLNGQIMTVSSRNPRSAPIVVCGVKDKELAESVVSELQLQSLRNSPLKDKAGKSKVEGGVRYWTWSDDDIKKYRDHFVKIILRGQRSFDGGDSIQPNAFSLSDENVAMSTNAQIKNLNKIENVPLAQQHLIGELFECVIEHDKTLDRPNLIWVTRSEYWQSYVATMNYDAKSKIETTRLADVKKLDKLREQILIRLANAATATIGQVIVVGKAEQSRIRVSAMLFSNPKEPEH